MGLQGIGYACHSGHARGSARVRTMCWSDAISVTRLSRVVEGERSIVSLDLEGKASTRTNDLNAMRSE